MKNLMVYINPSHAFTNSDWGDETDTLVKIQIDNSLRLGWDRKDIVLATNFPYEYNGVKAIVLGDDNYCEFSSGTPSKINAIVTMFRTGLIDDDMYMFHDFDSFQLVPITEDEIGLPKCGIALTNYGYTKVYKHVLSRWSTGTIFFNRDSHDVFEWIKTAVYKYTANEEVSLLALTRHDKHGICERVKLLNLTYNLAFRRRDVELCYDSCEKPIRFVHFHPSDVRPTSAGLNMDIIEKKNLFPKELRKLFPW
jgi:hypothetical protein